MPPPDDALAPEPLADAVPAQRTDAELAALVLAGARAGAGLSRCCRRALERSGGLLRLGRMAPRELRRERAALEAIEPGAARRLGAAFELGRRAERAELPVGRAVRRAADVEPYLRGQLQGERREVFLVVLLDARHRPFRAERVSEGCLTWAVVHPREVFGPAVREGAGAVLVAHNHPSGDPTPSRQDIEVTRRLQRSGDLLGVPLLDHIVVGRARCRSLRAEGHMADDADDAE